MSEDVKVVDNRGEDKQLPEADEKGTRPLLLNADYGLAVIWQCPSCKNPTILPDPRAVAASFRGDVIEAQCPKCQVRVAARRGFSMGKESEQKIISPRDAGRVSLV